MKAYILKKLQTIAATYDTSQKELYSSQLRSLAENISTGENAEENLAYFYHLLVDNDYIANNACRNFFISLADVLIEEMPIMAKGLYSVRNLPDAIFDLITQQVSPTLSELVETYKIPTSDTWIDPLTNQVMDYPVSYTINGTTHTVDLLTLLNNSNNSVALKCPFTRQYIFLTELRPQQQIVKQIRLALKLPILRLYKKEDCLLAAAKLVVEGNLAALKLWREKYPEIDLNRPIPSRENNAWTLLHYACKHAHFDIAVWLLPRIHFGNTDSKNRICTQLIDVSKLKTAITAAPTNPGLRFLLASFYAYSAPANLELYLENIEIALNEKFVPAIVQHGVIMINHNRFMEGFSLLREALKRGYPKAALGIYKNFNHINSVGNQAQQLQLKMDGITEESIIEDCIAALASKEIYSKEDIYSVCVTLLQHSLANPTAPFRSHNHIQALIYAHLGAASSFNMRAIDVACKSSLIFSKDTQYKKIISTQRDDFQGLRAEERMLQKMGKLGVLKPWVPYKARYTAF